MTELSPDRGGPTADSPIG